MATVGKFLIAVMLTCLLSSPLLLTSSTEVPLPTCPSENSLCKTGVGNGTGATIRQQCLCSDGRHCPANIDKKVGAVFFEEKWHVTCSPTDRLPICQPGQRSLLALSNSVDDGVDFQVLCVCPTPYAPGGASREIRGDTVEISIYCTGEQNSTENIHDESNRIVNNEVLPVSGESNMFYLSTENDKRSRGNTAFYKRGGNDRNLNPFYKRGPSDYSAFYKRDRNHLSSFYKRVPFLKRAPFYKRRFTITKRSVDDSFNDETSIEGSSLSKIGDLDEDLMGNFDKKDYLLNSFYKRGLGDGVSSFYKRGGYGTSSFYKRTPEDDSRLSSLQGDESGDFLTPEEESADVASLENVASDDDPSLFYKRSLSSFYKRNPWNYREGASSFDEKRAPGEGNSAFYKRDDSSEENDTDKRGRGQHLSSFYKRSRNNPSVSRFYKRYLSNTGDTYGISQFYKRGLGDVSNFYKRGLGDVSNFYKRGLGDVSYFYKRGASDDSRFYKRGFGDVSNFYKRGLGDVSNFYKRGLGDASSFYKRGSGDASSFYKRGLGDESSFYKRTRDYSRFYKRDVGGVSSFYKRDPAKGFAFYKRGFDGESNFYKRGFDDVSNFYKRGFSDLSNFYKRGDKLSGFYKKNAELSPSLLIDNEDGSEHVNRLRKRSTLPNENKRQTSGRIYSFYKRAFNDLNAFYKRAPSDESLYGFYKRDPYDNSVSHFYKRIPYDHSSSSFYKRTNDINAFYKRALGSNTMSNFYKRFGPDSNAFYKRFGPDLSSFYKRSPFDLQGFYKRTLDDGISLGDLENFMDQWPENYKNSTTDQADAGSIENIDDTSSVNQLGDSAQQSSKPNLP